jgi:hypothetical protein
MSSRFISALLILMPFLGARVECALDFQTGLGRRRADQLDHGKVIGERPATPVLRDVAEQPVLDLVSLCWRSSHSR